MMCRPDPTRTQPLLEMRPMIRSTRPLALAALLAFCLAPFVGCGDDTKSTAPPEGPKPTIDDTIKKDVKIAEEKGKELAGKAKDEMKAVAEKTGEKIKEAEAGAGKALQKAGAALEKAGTKGEAPPK